MIRNRPRAKVRSSLRNGESTTAAYSTLELSEKRFPAQDGKLHGRWRSKGKAYGATHKVRGLAIDTNAPNEFNITTAMKPAGQASLGLAGPEKCVCSSDAAEASASALQRAARYGLHRPRLAHGVALLAKSLGF